MTFHLNRLKSNMLTAVVAVLVLLISNTDGGVPVAKVKPPKVMSLLSASVPAEGPSGKITGYPGSDPKFLSPRDCDTGLEAGVGASPTAYSGLGTVSKLFSWNNVGNSQALSTLP